MKTAEEIIDSFNQLEVESLNSSRIVKALNFDDCEEAMKLYANAKLDEAAEKATAFLNHNDNPIVAKQSILSLKDKI
jgi:hypothetical protein